MLLQAEQMHKMTTIFTQNDNFKQWVKWMSFCAFAQLVTTIIFFSIWDKSHVKWDNSRNSTQKRRTLILAYSCALLCIMSSLWPSINIKSCIRSFMLLQDLASWVIWVARAVIWFSLILLKFPTLEDIFFVLKTQS